MSLNNAVTLAMILLAIAMGIKLGLLIVGVL